MLEVRVHRLDLRMPYGVNNSGPRVGRAAGASHRPAPKIIKFDTARNVALFSPDIEVPLAPFLGIMAVAPSRDVLLVSSRPPWRWGGNMDFKHLVPGADALPACVQQGRAVLHRRPACGAGRRRSQRHRHRGFADARPAIHRAQGRRQEHALAARRRRDALLRDGNGPRPRHRHAARDAGDGRVPAREFCASAADAYSLASIAIDFRIGEAVDSTQLVYGAIPKRLFKSTPPFWSAR